MLNVTVTLKDPVDELPEPLETVYVVIDGNEHWTGWYDNINSRWMLYSEDGMMAKCIDMRLQWFRLPEITEEK